LFMADRIKFCRPDGSEQPANSGAPPVLVAFGAEALMRLRNCGIAGALVTGWHNQPANSVLRRPVPSLAQAKQLGGEAENESRSA
jgi:hypothetical protein